MAAEPMEDRMAQAQAVLDRAGLAGRLSVAGLDGDIAAVVAPAGVRERLTELAPELRALGFRYVALEPQEVIEENEET